MKNSLSRLRDLDKMCRMLMKDIGDAYAIPGDLKGKQLLLRGLMNEQGHPEETGQAKITPGFNLPARYVIHTVGPIIPDGIPTDEQCEQLASCYRSCLQLAKEKGLSSIAFCCISTGVFRFPNQQAAKIAVREVKSFMKRANNVKHVIFNVFKDQDLDIYRRLLAAD